MESCEVCGFAWESVDDADLAPRIVEAAGAVARLLRAAPAASTVRPSPDRWSALEYGAHVRDVLLVVRDRLVVGLVEDDPTFSPMYRDERVDLGLYTGDAPDVVADELEMAAALFTRTAAELSADQLNRPCQYAYPTPATRSLRWMVRQVVHEVEHHRADAEQSSGAGGHEGRVQ